MQRELPNLDWLRVFAATATTESFALAALELRVTPGAVSQRIKALEAFLGVSLFQRHARGVSLTEAGKRYAQRVLLPLEQLTVATREVISAETVKSVRVTILPALAQLWLGPRMDDFHRRHASATVEIWADATVIDLRTSNFDVAIRYGKPPFFGCDHVEILTDELVPVAAPSLIETAELNPDGLPEGVPLMLDTYWPSDFDDWLRHTGCARPASIMTQTFSLYSMSVEATLNGRGFMIGHTSLLSDLIAQGKLQPLSPQRAPASNQFYMLSKSGLDVSETTMSFMDWVSIQAGQTLERMARLF
ncbi:LysR substrate-binding domain-containing protein [Sphingomonas sanxanigenens]|uniref:HTH lysR-type domain-containing protein n=1 Tax=Sphingomonas sanxanigenens DSM 19645 = NX02 TaxID=1123269 RepID=W0AF46_9SPHN|nr:LysR substrate-binding domain-containing protein [Sphingomonas sanxanigenens]AHE55152.1 hypothetical protein NX02_17370 [Sphingomonas sanxanigenens DSM 19645 = NX02]